MKTLHVACGACGFEATIRMEPRADGRFAVSIESGCGAVQRFADALGEAGLEPLEEITYQPELPRALAAAAACLPHPSCPVPVGVLKALEAAAGLALPADVALRFTEGEA